MLPYSIKQSSVYHLFLSSIQHYIITVYCESHNRGNHLDKNYAYFSKIKSKILYRWMLYIIYKKQNFRQTSQIFSLSLN